MPIYEFYCRGCHAIYSFLARSTAPRKRPRCPDCGAGHLERRASAFAVSRGRPGDEEADGLAGLDEERMERAAEALAQEAAHAGGDDPRALAAMVRRFYEQAGLRVGDTMQEAIRRMESGEDPDAIEQELGAALETENPLAETALGGLRRLGRRGAPPRVDRTLHEL